MKAKKKASKPGLQGVGSGLLLSSAAMKWQRQVHRALESLEMSATQYSLMSGLDVLVKADGPVTQTALARYVGTDLMLTSKHVRVLEDAGWVKRDYHPTDTRARLISLTRAGLAVLKQAAKIVEPIDRDFFTAVGSVPKFRKIMGDVSGWA